jgi:hypothetical protein
LLANCLPIQRLADEGWANRSASREEGGGNECEGCTCCDTPAGKRMSHERGAHQRLVAGGRIHRTITATDDNGENRLLSTAPLVTRTRPTGLSRVAYAPERIKATHGQKSASLIEAHDVNAIRTQPSCAPNRSMHLREASCASGRDNGASRSTLNREKPGASTSVDGDREAVRIGDHVEILTLKRSEATPPRDRRLTAV